MSNATKIVKRNQGSRVIAFGDEHLIKLEGNHTENLFSIIQQTYEPGSGGGAHRHERDSHIFIVIKGRFDVSIEGVLFCLEPWDLAFIPKGEIHEFTARGDEAGVVLVINLPAGLEHFFKENEDTI